jgi:D-glycero-D-manno-heptose 1,7-bisphosphate phosphatase
MNRAIFLDRDGVINGLVYRQEERIFDSPYSVDEFRLLPKVAEAISLVNEMGFLAVVVSNQPGVAKGKCNATTLDRLTQLMCQELEAQGARLDDIYYCLHHPEGLVPNLRQDCGCRKPKPGLLLEAARRHNIDLARSYVVGDNPKDIEAGLAAGCTAILLQQDSHEPPHVPGACWPHWIATNLLGAVLKIQQEQRKEERTWRSS